MAERRSRKSARFGGLALAALLIIAVCAGVAGLAASVRDVTWTATTKVVYGGQSSDALLGRSSLPDDVDRALATQAQILLGDTVMSAAAENLGTSPEVLTRTTEVANVTDSNVLEISTTADSPDEAARRTQGVAEQYVATSRNDARQSLNNQASALDPSIEDLRATIAAAPARGPQSDTTALDASLNTLLQQQSQLRAAAESETGPVQVLAQATAPTSPSSLRTTTAAVIGAGLGIVVVIGLLLTLSWARHDGDGHRVAPST